MSQPWFVKDLKFKLFYWNHATRKRNKFTKFRENIKWQVNVVVQKWNWRRKKTSQAYGPRYQSQNQWITKLGHFYRPRTSPASKMLDIHISRHLAHSQFKSQPTSSRTTYLVPLKANRKWQQLLHSCLLHAEIAWMVTLSMFVDINVRFILCYK